MLSDEQIQFYQDNGYIVVEDAVSPAQLALARNRTLELIDESRDVAVSNSTRPVGGCTHKSLF